MTTPAKLAGSARARWLSWRSCLGAVALVAGAPVAAQEPSEIVVMGQGLAPPPGAPAYGSVVIDHDRLTSDATGRLEDVLGDVAGLQQFRRSDSRSANPTAQGVTLRALGGNAASRALVLLDGVPQTDPFFGYVPFNAFPPDRLSNVRVTRGGGAGPFGAGALAGTIELSSATRAELPPYEASFFYGSRDSLMGSASISPNLGNGYVSLSGDYDRSDGYYTAPSAARMPDDVRASYENWSTALHAVAPLDNQTEVQARMLVYRDERTLRFAGANSDSSANDASVRLVHRGAWQIDALVYVQLRDFSYRVISSSSHKLVLDQHKTPSTGLGGKIELRPFVGPDHVLRIGADVRRASGELYESPYSAMTGLATAHRNAGGDTSTLGFFAEDDWTVGRLVLTGGARFDRWAINNGFYQERAPSGAITSDIRFGNRDGSKATARVGALLHASSVLALRVAAYTGFRIPTLNELYRPYVVYPLTTQANATLGLEKLKGIETGLDISPVAGVHLRATTFFNRLSNAIANVTVGPNLRQRQNVDAIVARGIELTASAMAGDFNLRASYAYDDSKVRSSGAAAALDGLAPAESPRHAASATLAWAPAGGPRLSATLRYLSKQYDDDLETAVLPHMLTLDAAASIPITRQIRLVGRAENVFNEKIVTANTGDSFELGAPRTLWIGLRVTG